MPPLKQLLLFCLVGVLTTVIDFVIFNLLTRPAWGWRRIPANILSVSSAMLWSFLANWLIVFRADGQDWLGRAGRFLITTGFSAFILQNLVLYLTTYVWSGPVRVVQGIVRRFHFQHRLNQDLISRNTCKTLAVSMGLVWNFCWYKFFVYVN